VREGVGGSSGLLYLKECSVDAQRLSAYSMNAIGRPMEVASCMLKLSYDD
jgi:hypothetical protein